LFKLLANAGDEFFVPTPSYPLFEPLATLEGVRTVYYKLRLQDRWEIDFDSLRAQLTEKTKGMIVVQPNNPTGSMLSFPEFKETCEIAQSHRVPLIVDEVFRSYSMNHSPDPITSLAIEKGPVTFTLGGLSKEFGLPQLKLGWIHVNGPDNEINTISERLDWICDAYLSVGTPVQQTLPAIFEIGPSIRQAIRQRIQKNNRILADQVGSSYRPLPVEGGWSAFVALPERIDEEEFALRLMSRDRVIVQPGYFFDLPFPSLVLSLLTPHTSFVQGLERIERQIPDFNG
jgi:hypothetical protein